MRRKIRYKNNKFTVRTGAVSKEEKFANNMISKQNTEYEHNTNLL